MFSLRVSRIFIFNTLETLKGVITGGYFSGGEIISSLEMSLSFINSSKVMRISLFLKLVVKFSGALRKITGAIVSRSPPLGLPFFAQSVKESKKRNTMGMYKRRYVFEWCCCCIVPNKNRKSFIVTLSKK